ncbi:MAG: septum formation protein [Gammaproteobacteria bacterium]|jgi:septum formation protein
MSKSDSAANLLLASASPRRLDLLQQIGVVFLVVPAHIDESHRVNERPSDYVRRMALEKAETVRATSEHRCPVLGADTTVSIDNLILGKPTSIEHAREMLQRLSGRWHEVLSGVAIIEDRAAVISVRTRVKFRQIAAGEIESYWASGEPHDKAGAYAIQGIGGAFVERIDGSYSNVVGLPMVETTTLLDDFAIRRQFAAGVAITESKKTLSNGTRLAKREVGG